MDFSQALLEIKAGKKVSRKTGPLFENGLYIKLQENNILVFSEKTNLPIMRQLSLPNEEVQEIIKENGPNFKINLTEIPSFWSPVSEGLLADDWYVIE